MDLRKTKRKRPKDEESSDDTYFRLSFPKERYITDEDTFYSCNSSEDSNYNPDYEIQPRSFLEGTEPRDYIKIKLDSSNPDIMPQEVVVYGYENASFVQQFRRPNKIVQPQILNSNMSKLTISPPRRITQSISTESSNTECGSIQDLEIPDSPNTMSQFEDDLENSYQSEFMDLSNYHMTRLPPCTQTTGHRIDEISKYVLTPNLEPGYISNLQFNMRLNTRNLGTINSILPEQESQFSYENPKSSSSSATSPTLNLDNEVSSETDFVKDPRNKYLCRTCDFKFRSQAPFLTHLRSHINLDTLICEICNEKLSNVSEMREHISKHSKIGTFFCEYCSMVFGDARFLETHMIRSIQGVTYACPACPMNFCSKIGYDFHLQTHRQQIKNVSKKELYSTKKRHKLAYKLSRKVVELSHGRIVNQRIVTPVPQSDVETVEPFCESPSNDNANQEEFCCPFCSRNFKTERHLSQHVFFHESQKEYSCTHCKNVFYHGDIFKTHIRNCRIRIKEKKSERPKNNVPNCYVCRTCKTTFKNERNLRLHTNRHKCHESIYLSKVRSRKRRTTCPNCLISFSLRSLLVLHISQGNCRDIYETDEIEPLSKPDEIEPLIKPDEIEPLIKPDEIEPLKRSFVCPGCDREYKNKKTLRQHTCHRTNHKTLPDVRSQQDTDLENSPQNLEVKPPNNEEHECTSCASIFSTKEDLIYHEQNNCLDSLPVEFVVKHKVCYFCPNCTEKFPSEELLNIHFRDCSSARPSEGYKLRSKRILQQQQQQQLQSNILDEKSSKFICDLCGESLKFLSSLQKHVMYRKCITYPLQKNNSLDKYNTQLLECVPYTCAVCNISLTSMSALLKHKRRGRCQISDTNSLDFVGERDNYMDAVHDQCAESSTTPTNDGDQSTVLKTEIVEKKENSNNFLCVYCNERFSDLKLFKSHIEATLCMKKSTLLGGWKVCSGCKRLFCNVRSIRRHLKTSCKFFNTRSPE